MRAGFASGIYGLLIASPKVPFHRVNTLCFVSVEPNYRENDFRWYSQAAGYL